MHASPAQDFYGSSKEDQPQDLTSGSSRMFASDLGGGEHLELNHRVRTLDPFH